MHLGLPAVNASYELRSFGTPATIFGRPIDGSNWSAPGHIFEEVTADRMSRTRIEQNYSYKTDFENRRENQNFGRQNISMSRPPLGSTPLGTNTNNRKMSPTDSIPAETPPPDPAQLTPPTDSPTLPMDFLTLPTESSKGKGKAHVSGDPESGPSWSDSSLNESDSLNDNKTFHNVLLAPDLYDRLFSIISLMNSVHTCLLHKGFSRCNSEQKRNMRLT